MTAVYPSNTGNGHPETPRYLNREELKDLVDALPSPRAFNKEIVALIRSDIQQILLHQYETEKISPTVIPILKKYIISMFYRSVQSPGALIGITAAESVGGPVTQANLKSFHNTGAKSNVPSGVEVARELFNASPTRKREIILFHFKDKYLTYEECMEKRKDIIGVTVDSLIVDSEFVDTDNAFVDKWWYPMFELIMNKPIPEVRTFLRLKIDTVKLYGYKYTLSDVAKAIEGNQDSVVKCVYSPTNLGIIDIYADRNQMQTEAKKIKDYEKKRLGLGDDNSDVIFLQIIVLPNLNKVTVKGINDITEMSPIDVNTWGTVVQSVIKLTHNDRLDEIDRIQNLKNIDQKTRETLLKEVDYIWKIYIDPVKVKMTRVPLVKITTLFEKVGPQMIHLMHQAIPQPLKFPSVDECSIEILSAPKDIDDTQWHPKEPSKYAYTPFLYTVKMRPSVVLNIPMKDEERKRIKTPYDVIQRLASIEKQIKDQWMKDRKSEGKLYPIYSDSKFSRAYTYFYAECVGGNYKAALRHPDVDPFRTTCNNPHYILANFGTEATRNACTMEFYSFITGVGSYINPRHLLLIPEFMNNLGFITAITSRGISRQNPGPYALASFEQPMNAFKNGMAHGRREEVLSTSTCIMTGVKGRFGTNYFKTKLNVGLLELADVAKKEFEQTTTLGPISSEDIANGLKKIDIPDPTTYMFQGEQVNSDTLFDTDPEPATTFQVAPLSPRATNRTVANTTKETLNLLLAPKGPLPALVKLIDITMVPWIQAILENVPETFGTIPSDLTVTNRPMSPHRTLLANPGLPILPSLNADKLLEQGAKNTVAHVGVIPLDLSKDDWL
jgi:hypothetical protein